MRKREWGDKSYSEEQGKGCITLQLHKVAASIWVDSRNYSEIVVKFRN